MVGPANAPSGATNRRVARVTPRGDGAPIQRRHSDAPSGSAIRDRRNCGNLLQMDSCPIWVFSAISTRTTRHSDSGTPERCEEAGIHGRCIRCRSRCVRLGSSGTPSGSTRSVTAGIAEKLQIGHLSCLQQIVQNAADGCLVTSEERRARHDVGLQSLLNSEFRFLRASIVEPLRAHRSTTAPSCA